MWCHFRQDFLSLFARTNDRNTYFYPVDGLRAITSLLIISCHLVTIFNTFIPSYPHAEWEEFLKSLIFALSPVLAYALEIFFMLSGFLLTHKLIIQWNKNNTNHYLFLKQYPILILKRAMRFWPGMILSTLIMFVCGEPRYPNSDFLLESLRHLSVWMFYQNYVNIEYWLASLAPLWSVSLDMQVHIILPLLLYLFYSCRRYISIYHCLTILLILSMILSIMIFDMTTMPIVSITRRSHNLPLLLPAHYVSWLKKNYNLTFAFQIPQSNPMKLFLQKMYLPLEARFGSFIVGAMLAIQLIDNLSQNNRNSKLKKFVFFGLILVYVLSPMIVSVDTPLPHFESVAAVLIAISRQLFALGQAFILFTALCPSSHPYHSPWVQRFLSLSIWIPISKLSYLVYLIHWRISLELIFGGPLIFLKAYSITYAVFISLPIILFVSQLVSGIWYILVEKPFERAIFQYLNSYISYKTHLS